MTPTARTLKHLRELGFVAQVVEKWLPQARRRVDLFGCIDILAVKPGEPILGVQATSGSNVSSRLRKAASLPDTETVLKAGLAIEVWGWAKRGGRGQAKVWTVSRRPLTLENLSEYRSTDD